MRFLLNKCQQSVSSKGKYIKGHVYSRKFLNSIILQEPKKKILNNLKIIGKNEHMCRRTCIYKFRRTPIKLGVRTYMTYANCQTL